MSLIVSTTGWSSSPSRRSRKYLRNTYHIDTRPYTTGSFTGRPPRNERPIISILTNPWLEFDGDITLHAYLHFILALSWTSALIGYYSHITCTCTSLVSVPFRISTNGPFFRCHNDFKWPIRFSFLHLDMGHGTIVEASICDPPPSYDRKFRHKRVYQIILVTYMMGKNPFRK